jgi:hypothetical protein
MPSNLIVYKNIIYWTDTRCEALENCKNPTQTILYLLLAAIPVIIFVIKIGILPFVHRKSAAKWPVSLPTNVRENVFVKGLPEFQRALFQ